MSCPIGNILVIKATDEIFHEIASRIIDSDSGLTTYEKVCPVQEGLTESEIDDWFDIHYECPKGFDGFIDETRGLIDFTTNWRCAEKVIECLAPQYPQARIEFSYTIYDDEVGIFDCRDIYEDGALISREQILDPNSVEDWDEDEDEDE